MYIAKHKTMKNKDLKNTLTSNKPHDINELKIATEKARKIIEEAEQKREKYRMYEINRLQKLSG